MAATAYEPTLRDFLSLCRRHWRWFAVSTVSLLCLAVLFLLVKQPVYERSSQVMVKEDGNPASKLSAGLSMLQGIGGFSSLLGASANVSNEMLALQTPQNIVETIKRLHIDYDYKTWDVIGFRDLYGDDAPLQVTISGMTDTDAASLKIDLKGEQVHLYKLRKNKDKFPNEYDGRLGQTFKTAIGSISVVKVKGWKADDDMTIRIRKHAPISKCIYCQKKLEIAIVEEMGSVIELLYSDVVAQRAEDFLNTLIDVYNEQWMSDEDKLTRATSDFIDQRIAVVEQELTQVENGLMEYIAKNRVADMAETAKLYMNTANAIDSSLIQLSTQHELTRYMSDYIRQHPDHQLLPTNIGLSDAAVAKQIETYNTQLIDRNNLAQNSNTTNPLVVDMDKQLSAMRNSIVAALNTNENTMRIRLQGMHKLERRNDTKIAASPAQGKVLMPAERNQQILQALYIFLLEKRESNLMSEAFTPYKLRILSAPMGDIEPSFPRPLLTIFLALLMGLFIPATILFIKLNLLSSTK